SSVTLLTRIRSNLIASWSNRGDARQNNAEFGELARFGIDLDGAGMLFDNDIVAQRQAEPGAFAGWLGGEERIEHLLLHFRRNARAVVANPDFHAVAEPLGRGR